MTAIVQKWGNSLAVRLPKAVASQIEASEGAELEMQVVENALILKAAKRHYSLSDLIGRITAENLHTEVDWGKPKGKEAW
jgi:antitoxin MazE